MENMTRDCLDPWEYIEFRPGATVSPCCAKHAFHEPMAGDLYDSRDSDAFRSLREALLSGNLDVDCQACSHKEVMSVSRFQKRIREVYPELSDLCDPARRIRTVRVDMTERCNLRCTYCAASQPGYRGIVADGLTGVEGGREMASGEIDRIIDEIRRYPDPIGEVAVNGHGETTCYHGWHKVCEKLLKDGQRLTITSNFARSLDPDEVAVLSRFAAITISIDTADPNLLESIRRKVDLGTILSNLFRVRARSLNKGRRPPHITFHAGLYDRNLPTLVDFSWFCVACGIDAVVFWKLVKYSDLQGTQNVHPIHTITSLTSAEAIETIETVREILTRHEIEAIFPPGFIKDLRQSFEERIELAFRHSRSEGNNLSLSIVLKFETPDADRRVNLYLAASKIGTSPLLLDDFGKFRVWEGGHRPPPVHRVLDRLDQVIDLSVSMDGLQEGVSLIVGCGESIAQVIREASYITIPFLQREDAGRRKVHLFRNGQ